MFSKPHCGWTEFQLSTEKIYSMGYLTDVAFDWLDQAIHGLETMDVFSVHGFCEPNRMVCTVSYWSCYVILEEEDPKPTCKGIEHVHISMIDFCKELYEDINDNLEDWVHWNDGEFCYLLEKGDKDGFETALARRREALQNKLNKLKTLIDKREEHFGEHRCFF